VPNARCILKSSRVASLFRSLLIESEKLQQVTDDGVLEFVNTFLSVSK